MSSFQMMQLLHNAKIADSDAQDGIPELHVTIITVQKYKMSKVQQCETICYVSPMSHSNPNVSVLQHYMLQLYEVYTYMYTKKI